MSIKFWNLRVFIEDEQLIEVAKFSEALGVDAVGVSDHLSISETIESRYPGSKRGRQALFTIDSRWSFPDPWVALVTGGSP